MPFSPAPRLSVSSAPRPAAAVQALAALLFAALMVAAFWPHPAHAANPTFNRRTFFGPGSDSTSSVALGDMDGDGDLDIVAGNYDEPSKVYFNNGRGGFADARTFSNDSIADLAVGDLNGDGALDIVAVGDGQDYFYFNQGTGKFTAVPLEPSGDRTSAVAVGDLNGDGAFDIVVGGYYGQQGMVYFNNGSGGFSRSASFSVDDLNSLALGDLNGDGALDIVANEKVYFNNGQGSFLSLVSYSTYAREIAIGDINGDGALDIVAGQGDSGPGLVYFNDGMGNFPSTATFDPGWIDAVAVGDLNGDGHLDIVAGGGDDETLVNFNDGAGNFSSSVFFTTYEYIRAAAVGDLNGDGALDIVTGNTNQDFIYFNDGYNNFVMGTDFNSLAIDNETIAVGDLNADRALDIVAGGNGQSYIYLNNGSGSFPTALPSPGSVDVLGDLNGDGALDMAGGTNVYLNNGSGSFPTVVTLPSAVYALGDMNNDGSLDIVADGTVYFNDGRGNFPRWVVFGVESYDTEDIAVGDLNDDDAIDIVVARTSFDTYALSEVYFNDGSGNFPTRGLFVPGPDETTEVTLGDMNGDGSLDIIAQIADENVIYFNDGRGSFSDANLVPVRLDYDWLRGSSWLEIGDLNGDDTFDIVARDKDGRYQVLFNDGRGNFATSTTVGAGLNGPIAFGDINGDGTLDIVHSDGQIFWNRPLPTAYVNNYPAIAVRRPGPTADAPFYSTPAILSDGVIAVPLTLFDAESDPAGKVRAFFSLNGGGRWFEAKPAAGSATSNLTTAPYPSGQAHTFLWDTAASGLFGRYDNVVLRFEVSAQPPYNGTPGSVRYVNAVPGPFLWPYAAATTFPFRVRGMQVRVFRERQAAGNAAAGALVYRLPSAETVGSLMRDAQGRPLTTDAQGYLAGHGVLQTGDQLLALAPLRRIGKGTLYATNGRVTAGGVEGYTVAQGGVQPLVVSAAAPLLLFDLTLSLEWDAGKDAAFQARLRQHLQQTSAALYDWSNGQVALGQVTVYQNREQWETADIRLYASNQLRPVANRGGVVDETRVLMDPRLTQPITATRGEVRIGTVWSRYGEPTDIGSDWPNVLAHELGHYLLFLEDSYLGLNAQGLLAPVDSCTGTAMSDPYEAVNSEFRAAGGGWQTECGPSLAELPDWELIRLAYPELQTPPPANAGPATMPFGLTTVTIQPAPAVTPPAVAPPLLDDANIELGAAGDLVAGGRAYLLKADRLVDLGQPVVNAVQAWGAQTGDELCVFGRTHFTCSPLSAEGAPRFAAQGLWTPELTLTPVNTTTVRLGIRGVGAAVTLYPNGGAPQQVTLAAGVEKLVTLNQPAAEVWVSVVGPDPVKQRLVTGYTIGAGPGRIKSHGGPGRIKSHGGPFTSGDGAVTIYPPKSLPDDGFLVVQTAYRLPPNLPPGLTPIGRAYRIQASASVADYSEASLTYQYLGMDLILAGAPEAELALYFWDETTWRRLATVLNRTQNFASAALPGPGLYLLMSGYAVPLPSQGWNLVSYPLLEARALPQALASIADAYTTVYGYRAEGAADPWQVYSPQAPGWVNDLTQFEPGRGYWIHATRAITLYLEGVPLVQGAAVEQAASLPTPPATFYGAVQGSADFSPAAGMAVVATVAGARCGQGQTRLVDGQVVYQVDVAGAAAGCGLDGQRVRFSVGGRAMRPQGVWGNQTVQELALAPQPRTPGPEPEGGDVYLPVALQGAAAPAAAAAQPAQPPVSAYLPLLAR